MPPAQAGSRKYFQQGELMPAVSADYGATIWQWNNDQSDATFEVSECMDV